jgi:hypothetical protein
LACSDTPVSRALARSDSPTSSTTAAVPSIAEVHGAVEAAAPCGGEEAVEDHGAEAVKGHGA